MERNFRKFISTTPGLKSFMKTSRRLFFQTLLRISVFLRAGFKIQSALLQKDGFSVLIWFSPYKITHRAPQSVNKYYIQKIDVNGIKKIEESTPTIAPTIEKMFVKNESYKLTPQFDKMVKQVKRGQKAYYCETIEDVHCYFQNLMKAYDSMSSNGYLLQKELKEKNNNLIDPRHKDDNQDEIQVVVNENNQLLLDWAGTHRLLIARILELEKVAGLVKYVDEEWAKKVFYDSETKNLKRAIETKLKNMSLCK